eukprot:m.26932 g.26932  ORF g.26932 m.26932 type:complete len:63 (+) comp39132_c0_seq1:77-265(+)
MTHNNEKWNTCQTALKKWTFAEQNLNKTSKRMDGDYISASMSSAAEGLAKEIEPRVGTLPVR